MDAQLRAITDPTRRAILKHLAGGEYPAGEVAALFDVSRPAISHHLRVLREAELVSVRQEAQSRLYSVNVDAIDRLRVQFDGFWEAALPRLKAVVEAAHSSSGSGSRRRD